MKDIEDRIRSYKDTPWCSNPKAYQNIVHEDDNVIVFKDRFPVTEGHLLYVPKEIKYNKFNISRCFELAYERGEEGIKNGEWDGFNVGINNGESAGQSVMWPHVHLIPRRKGDNPNPRGGVRNVIPLKGDYDDTTEGDWENEGGMALPEPAPCSRTALVRDRAIDEIKFENKKTTNRVEKVDETKWAKIVQRMKDKERKQRENK